MILKLISCEIFYREMCAAVAGSPHRVDLVFLPKGLHDLPPGEMPARVQAVVDETKPGAYDAVLIGYGLCNNGLAGVAARDCPLVVPRAHDCITLFLGSRRRYREYFDANPGTYFLTSGWMERGDATGDLADQSVQQKLGMNRTLEQLIEQYGEDNARYLFKTLREGARHYSRIAYMPMGVEPEDMAARAKERADQRKWAFETVPGDLRLIRKLVNGDWDPADFLVIPPGGTIRPSFDEDIVRS